MNKAKKIVDTIYKIPGKATIAELYKEIQDKQLFVEPLSENQTLEGFILEGGTGFNALAYGSLGEKIYEIRASYDNKPFTYGLPFSTLYATGYPLQRMVEGSQSNDFVAKFSNIEYVTLPLKEKDDVTLFWKKSSWKSFTPPPFSTNAFYLNSTGAKLFGLAGEGFCVVLPKARAESMEGWKAQEDSLWENRFFIDRIDNDQTTMKFFTQKSTVEEIRTKVIEISKIAAFFVLFTKKGMLVVVSGTDDELHTLYDAIKELPFTYKL